MYTDVQKIFKSVTKAQRHSLGAAMVTGAIFNLSLKLMRHYNNTGDISKTDALSMVRIQPIAHPCTHTLPACVLILPRLPMAQVQKFTNEAALLQQGIHDVLTRTAGMFAT